MAITYLSGQRVQGVSNAATTDGDYTVLKFTGNGTFTPAEAITAEILVIAGGGGASSGGGGSGGLLTKAEYSMTAQAYTITVGAGGGGVANTSTASSGANSTIVPASGTTITALGGGGGGLSNGASGAAGLSGGSGGGGGASNGGYAAGGSSTQGDSGGATGVGFAGGTGRGVDPWGAGGGGGAAEVGVSADSGGVQPAGGDGVQNDITGVNIYYAGGGGAFLHPSQSAGGAGGQGGGGQGGNSNTAGTDGLGAGGGGGGGDNSYTGKDGGDGVVIFRFLTSKGYSATGTYESTDEKTLVTDVPAGSEFEQTDDYKTYQFVKTSGSGDVTWDSTTSNNVTISGNTVTGTSGVSDPAWRDYARTVEQFNVGTGLATITFQCSQAGLLGDNEAMGFGSDPLYTSGDAYTYINYCMYFPDSPKNIEILENNVSKGTDFGTWSSTKEYKITIDADGVVRYYLAPTSGGTMALIYTSLIPIASGTAMYGHAALHSSGDAIQNVTFDFPDSWVERGTAI